MAGSGMRLWRGPFCTVPGTQVSEPYSLGTYAPEKSSFAFSLNSTRIVSRRASWVALAPLYWLLICFGFWPVLMALASSLASWRAATGLPLGCLRSTSMALAMASCCLAPSFLPTFLSVPKAFSARGWT